MNEVALGSLGSDLPVETLNSAVAPFLAELALYFVYLIVESISYFCTLAQLECHFRYPEKLHAKSQIGSSHIERARVIFTPTTASPKPHFKSLNFNTFYHFDGTQGCF